MHRRDFVIGGIKVSLSFLAFGALGLPAFGRPPEVTGPMANIDDSLNLMASYLLKYTPPTGNFPASGAWKATYDLIEWGGAKRRKFGGNRVIGHMSVTSRPGMAGMGIGYDLNYAIEINGYESALKSTMQCSDGRLPGLVEWKTDYKNHPTKKAGPSVGYSEQGSYKDGILEITSMSGSRPGSTRQFKTDRPVVPQWAIMDALRNATADSADPFAGIEFDLLHDLTSYRPQQRLKPCGVINITFSSQTLTFHGFLQEGIGSEPINYWVDAAGRPMLFTGGLLASALTSVQGA